MDGRRSTTRSASPVGVINHESSYVFDPTHVTPEDVKQEDEVGSFKVMHDFLRPVKPPRFAMQRTSPTAPTTNSVSIIYATASNTKLRSCDSVCLLKASSASVS